MAEYHEYDLRCCLATYVITLTNRSLADATARAIKIMTDDKAFVEAVQTYKNVVTHYFAAKTEIWMALFMSPVFGVDGGNLAMEFAKSRGCIHFHSVLQAAHRALRVGNDELRAYAKTISDSMKTIDQFIDGQWTTDHDKEFPTRPSKVFNQTGLELRERFCDKTPEGKAVMEHYHQNTNLAHARCERVIGQALQEHFGYTACHPGNAPGDCRYPVGHMKDDYRPHSEWPQMLSKKKVQKKRQLRQPRWNVQYSMGHPLPSPQPSRHSGDEVPEHDPPATTTFQAQCNCLNQAFCHSCSDYCYRCTNVQVKHDNIARFLSISSHCVTMLLCHFTTVRDVRSYR